jgi:hypothetical protein
MEMIYYFRINLDVINGPALFKDKNTLSILNSEKGAVSKM